MDRFGIKTNIDKDSDLSTTQMICDYLQAHGKVCLKAGDFEGQTERFVSGLDCIIVLGGDGTLIRAAREYGAYKVPLIGVNMGTLGFLTSVEKENVQACLDALMADHYTIKTRMMLSGSVYHQGKRVLSSEAVNDIIVNRSNFSKLVELKLFINDDLVDIYAADGVIVSTPTGSTGYNLSAGGPVVYPETELMVITPICPHSLTARSIVVSGREKVRIEVGRRSKTQQETALATYDGQALAEMSTYDSVEIVQAKDTVKLIEVNDRSFYQVLRDKIGNV